MRQKVKEVTFSTVPGVGFVLHFSALFFFASQSSARCYHPSTSPVLYPEDRKDPSNPPLPSSNEFQFLVLPRLFSPVLLLRNGMERSANHLSPAGFLKKRESRVPETAVDTQLGLGQVRSGSKISTNRGLAIGLFFLLLKRSRNASRLPRIGAFPFQLWRVGGIFDFSFLVAFEKGLQMVRRTDHKIALAFQNESAIESSKRNQNIGISHRTF
jgi:hypothetical protein